MGFHTKNWLRGETAGLEGSAGKHITPLHQLFYEHGQISEWRGLEGAQVVFLFLLKSLVFSPFIFLLFFLSAGFSRGLKKYGYQFTEKLGTTSILLNQLFFFLQRSCLQLGGSYGLVVLHSQMNYVFRKCISCKDSAYVIRIIIKKHLLV